MRRKAQMLVLACVFFGLLCGSASAGPVVLMSTYTVQIQGPGTVTVDGSACGTNPINTPSADPATTACTRLFPAGQSTAYSMAASTLAGDDAHFVGWQQSGTGSGCGGLTALTCTATVTGNATVTAVFADSVAPTLNASNIGASASPTVTTDPDGTFDIPFTPTTADPSETFQCRVDGGAFAPCTSPYTIDHPSNGDHTFTLEGRDPSGNIGQISKTLRLHTGPTNLTVQVKGPGAVAVDGSDCGASSSGASTSAAAQVVCTRSFVYGSMTAFGMAASVLPGDDAHFVGWIGGPGCDGMTSLTCTLSTDTDTTTTAVFADTIAPALTPGNIEVPPSPDVLTSDSGTFAIPFEATSADPDATFRCALDGAALEPCTSPATLSNPSDGDHGFTLEATDASGNVSSVTKTIRLKTEITPSAVTSPLTPTAPAPSPSISQLPAVKAKLSYGFKATRSYTVLRRLTLTRVPPRAAVTATCRGKGCPVKRLLIRKPARTVSLKRLTKHKLRPGVVIEVRVSKKGVKPFVERLQIRKGKRPTATRS